MSVRTSPEWQRKMQQSLATHHGVVSIAALEQFGAPRRTVANAVQRGELVPIMLGVLRSPHWPLGREQLMVASCLRNPSAAIAFTTAAQLWGMRRLPRDGIVHVLVPHGCSPALPGVIVHRCRRVDAVDVVCSRPDGIRLTSPPRTLFDCADILGVDATASVLEQLIDSGRGSFGTHVDTWIRLARPRRPGARTMSVVVRSRPAWRQALQSDLEARVVAEIARQGLAAPEVQFPLQLPTGRNVRLDFAWPAVQVALEVDHFFWHAGASESHLDKHRDRKMASAGWVVARLTDLDVAGGLADSVADVGRVLALASQRSA